MFIVKDLFTNKRIPAGLIVVFSLLFCRIAQAQSVLITDTNYTAHPSAILDVFSYNKGLLLPRLDSAAIQAISNPATSLLVYQQNAVPGFYYFNGSTWVPVDSRDSIAFYKLDSTAGDHNMDSITQAFNFPYSTVFYTDSIRDPGQAWLWNGKKYMKLGKSKLKIYKNYTELRNDTLAFPEMVFVKDFTTTANNKVYTTYGGFFIPSDTVFENGGTYLKNKKNRCWKRIWDQQHVYPEWWEVGGYDEQGKIYQNDKKLDGIQEDGDRLNAACYFSEKPKIIELRPGYVYEHNNLALTLYKYDILHGNNAIIKRKPVKSQLMQPAMPGTNTFTVLDASDFRIGMPVLAFYGSAYGQQSYNNADQVITAINGNVITVYPNTNNQVDTGVVQAFNDQVAVNGTDVHIENTHFDGNVQVVNATYSWVHANCVKSYYRRLHIRGSSFRNMPSDCITAPSELWVDNCYIENLYGAFLHGSSGPAEYFEQAGFYVKNVKGRDICKVPPQVNGHASQYGFYSQSLATKNVVIEGCYIENGNYGGIISPLTATSDQFSLQNNYFMNFSHVLSNISIAANSTGVEDLRVADNTFINCGVLNVEAGIHSAPIYKNLNITNNMFINGKLNILATEKANITGNTLVFQPDSLFSSFSDKDVFGVSQNALLNLSAGSAIVSDNVIQFNDYDTTTFTGIKIYLRNNTTLSRLTIDNNQISGVRRGIETVYLGANVYRDHITISNNLIATKSFPTGPVAEYAAQIGHGIRFLNNYIRHYDPTIALRVYGSNNASDAISCVVTGNTIEGGMGVQVRVYNFNNIIHNNLLTGTFQYDNITNQNKNTVGMNYVFSNTTKKVVPTLRNFQLHSGTTAPAGGAPNGSMYTNETTGDTYLRIQGAWKKIIVQ